MCWIWDEGLRIGRWWIFAGQTGFHCCSEIEVGFVTGTQHSCYVFSLRIPRMKMTFRFENLLIDLFVLSHEIMFNEISNV